MIPYDRWRPLDLRELREVLSGAHFRWCLAGGHAIERFVGRELRKHGEVDVVVFRDEQLKLQEHLAEWGLYAADPPGHLRPWKGGEYLEEGVHDIWCHRKGSSHWELQVMLQETSGDRWVYRRDKQISGRLDDFIETYGGWPCIRIEAQLLYKSKAPRPKDDQDFESCLPHLDERTRERLRRYLELAYRGEHSWLRRLYALSRGGTKRPG